MEKELDFVEPEVMTYDYELYPLGIMKAHGERYKEWMLSNYIQLNCHENIARDKEVFLAFYDDSGMKSPFLKVEKLLWSVTRSMGYDMKAFFRKCIDLECYIFLKIDEFYIPHRWAYRKHRFLHDNLIIGYDDENFIVLGYDENNECTRQKVHQDQMMEGLYSNQSDLEKKVWEDDIYIYRYVDYDYKLNIKLIKESLYNFLHSTEHQEEVKRFAKPLEDTVFGLAVYDKVLEYLKILSEGKDLFQGNIDIRIFRLLREHKRIMLERIQVIHSKFENLNGMYEKYEKIFQIADMTYMIAIKYRVKEDKEYLYRMAEYVRSMKQGDQTVLGELYERLAGI